MTEYRDFKYRRLSDGSWQLVFPNGAKFTTPIQSEETLKGEIDKFIGSSDSGSN